MTNMFALAERFTYRHSSLELESTNAIPPVAQLQVAHRRYGRSRNSERKEGRVRMTARSGRRWSRRAAVDGTRGQTKAARKRECAHRAKAHSRVSLPPACARTRAPSHRLCTRKHLTRSHARSCVSVWTARNARAEGMAEAARNVKRAECAAEEEEEGRDKG